MSSLINYSGEKKLTTEAKDRLSIVAVLILSVRVMASFPDISSKSTTPNAYTSLFVVARPSRKYLKKPGSPLCSSKECF
jgi:hypothetical protein